jgi:hypothetical protein
MIGCHCHSPKRFGCGIWLRQAAIIPKPKSRRNFLRAVFSFLIESPFTQTMWVALAALCNFHDPVAMISCTIFLGCPKPKMSSIALVVSIRHHLNACRFKHRIADEWNSRGPGSLHQ